MTEAEQALARVEEALSHLEAVANSMSGTDMTRITFPADLANKTASSIRLLLSLARQVGEMREALEPFAKAADKLDGKWAGDDWRWNDSVRSAVTVNHIRAARAALSQSRSEK